MCPPSKMRLIKSIQSGTVWWARVCENREPSTGFVGFLEYLEISRNSWKVLEFFFQEILEFLETLGIPGKHLE